MRRGCLFGSAGVLVLCLLLCAVAYFVGLPRFRSGVQDSVKDSIGTEVAQQIPAVDGTAEPGSYTLTEAELQASLIENLGSSNVNDIVIRIDETGLAFGLTTEGSGETTYTGLPVAENGLFVMTNMKASDGVLDFFFPASDLGEAIEEAVNDYLAQTGLALESIDLADGALTLNTVAAQ